MKVMLNANDWHCGTGNELHSLPVELECRKYNGYGRRSLITHITPQNKHVTK